MSAGIEITGGADPETAAAIIAAVRRLDEEYVAALAVPPTRPAQGMWVLSTRPRPMQSLPMTRTAPTALGWSVISEDGDAET